MVNNLFEPLGGLQLIVELNCKEKDMSKILNMRIPQFYQDVLRSWTLLQKENQYGVKVNENHIIWGNNQIRYKGEVLYFKKWINANIIYLKDIISDNRFINLKELENKVQCPKNFFNIYTLLTSIPEEWKRDIENKKVCKLKNKSNTVFTINNKAKYICEIQTKEIYKLLNNGVVENTCIKYWDKHSIGRNTCTPWKSIFRFKLCNRIFNKIGHFQYNVLNNLICCRRNLFIWKLSPSSICNICKEYVDNYEHFFVNCNYNNTFWKHFSDYMKHLHQGEQFSITLDKIICGWNIDKKKYTFANILIEIASFAIYKSKMIFNETNKLNSVNVIFMIELKKLDEIIQNSQKATNVEIDKKHLQDCKVYWNVK